MPSHYDRNAGRRNTPRQAGPPATGQPVVRSAIPQPRSPLNPQRLTTPQPQMPLPSERVRSIVETDSPLMRQAATQGKQYAHRRGLLNSSLAAGAAQNSLLAHAFPMAQADTSAALQGRSLDINRQQADDAWQQSLIDYALNRDRFISDTDLRNRQLTLTDRINTGRLDLDRERFVSDADLAQDRLGLDRERFVSDADLAQDRLGLDRELGTRRLDLEGRGLDLGYDRLAQDRRQSNLSAYAGMYGALLNNPNIDKDTRGKYMLSLRKFLDEMEKGEDELGNTDIKDPDGEAAAGAETVPGGQPQEPPPQEPPPEEPPQEPPPQEPPPEEPPAEQPPPQPPQTQGLPPPGDPGWNSIPPPGGVPSWDWIPYHSRYIFV